MTDREMEKAIEKGIMTNELAIKLLSEVELVCLYEEETYEALHMAIKALEQQEHYKEDLINARDNGYTCGYTDAMIDIAEGSESK
jgi:hypothetical protein